MNNLAVYLFGRPQFFVDGAEVSGFNTRKDCALLAYLAATGTAHSREHLAGLLWTDQPEDTARRNLRHALSQLHKVIGPGWIETAGGVGLSRRLPWSVDVQRLQAAVAGLSTPAGQAPPAALEQALAAYRGEFLQGFYVQKAAHFEEWLLARREEYHLLALRGLEVVAQAALQDGDAVKGLAATRRLLQLEPWSESAHCLQMQLLVATGQRAAALAQYESCRQLLAAELGVEPMPATTALYQQIQTGQYGRHSMPEQVVAPTVTTLAAAPPPPPPLPFPLPQPEPASRRVPNNLLAPLAAFVGRQAELDFICRQLAARDCRLLTIVGPGGMGKSSLALAVGQRLLTGQAVDFPDGIFWVPLAEIGAANPDHSAAVAGNGATDEAANEAGAEEMILRAIAAQLDNALGAGAASVAQLQAYLGPRRLLLILDEFEHLLAGAKAVVTLLAKAPQVKLLIASRARLNVRGETVLTLARLSLPPVAYGAADAVAVAGPTVAGVDEVWQASEAIAMFVQRARQLDPTFAIDAATLAPVWQICQLVDGLPLGIELAASMLPLLSCTALAKELAKSLDFLAADTRDLPRDQHTLRAVFERSWHLLSLEGQLLLARLAIFPSSFAREAAEYIAGASLSSLQYLLNQSLLGKVGDGRYAMHPTIHAFAEQKLQHWPAQIESLHVRYAHFYLDYLAHRESELAGFACALTVQAIETDLHNVQAAWRRAVTCRMAAELNRCLYAFYLFGEQQRFNIGIIDLYTEALHEFGSMQTPPNGEASAETTLLLGRLYCFFGVRCVRHGRFEQAQAAYASSWSLLQRVDDPAAAAVCLAFWGTVQKRSDLRQAAARLAEAVQLIDQTGAEWIKALLYAAHGEACLLFGNYAEAAALIRKGGALAEQIGLVRGIATAYKSLARVYISLGQYSQAEAQLRAGIGFTRQHRLYMLCLESIISLGEALRHQERLDEARACFVESRQLVAALGGGLLTALVLWEEGCLAEQCGEYATAKARFVASTAIGLLPWWSHALPTLGWALIGLGELDEAHAYFQKIAAAAEAEERLPILLDAQLGLLYLEQVSAQQQHAAGPTWSAEIEHRLHAIYHNPAATAETRQRIARIAQQSGLRLPASRMPD